MAEVKLPLVGGVSKKALAIGGIAAAATVGLFLLRKRKTAAAAPAAAAADPNATASSDYIDPGLQDTTGGPTYGATGYTDPNTGQWVYGNTGTGQAAATTNAQWSQNAISYLSGSGTDTGALAQALGAYLQGQAVTTAQESLIDQAIAVEGYPPVAGASGYPPGIRTSDTGTGAGGSGGSGGGVTGSGGSVTVPATAGHTAGTAHNQLVAAHLVPVADPGQKATWIVTSTTPRAGAKVPSGTRVLITASAPAAKKK